jgi:hypothetical protein
MFGFAVERAVLVVCADDEEWGLFASASPRHDRQGKFEQFDVLVFF